MKARQCRECGEDFQYDWESTPFRWYCDEHLTIECQGEGCGTRLPRRGGRYCSPECRSPSYQERGSRHQAWAVCKCGQQFRRYENGSRRRYCSVECRRQHSRVGERLRNDPELARQIARRPKPGHGLRGYKQTEEHLVRRLGTGAIRASREELSLVPVMEKLGFRHTGEGAFWRRWPDGTIHNPDFVNEETRVVMEYFGSYWHQPEEVEYAKEQWKAIGYDCLIVWDHEREAFVRDAGGD